MHPKRTFARLLLALGLFALPAAAYAAPHAQSDPQSTPTADSAAPAGDVSTDSAQAVTSAAGPTRRFFPVSRMRIGFDATGQVTPAVTKEGSPVQISVNITNISSSPLDAEVAVVLKCAQGITRQRIAWPPQQFAADKTVQLVGSFVPPVGTSLDRYEADLVVVAANTGQVLFERDKFAAVQVSKTYPAPTPSSGGIYWGVNLPAVPGDMNVLAKWERDVTGKAVSIVHWGHFWDKSGGYRSWSSTATNNARNHGSIPMISWTPEGGDDTRWQLAKIIRGDHDAYIRQFATDAKNWGHPFFLRFGHEMNGSFGYPWQEDENGNRRGEFVQAWQHIHDIFRSVGTSNASWVWCPNIDYPNSPWPSYASLYPGDTYVDWTCLDGYNWGATRSPGWQTFDQVYDYSYNEVLKVAPKKPMMIGEFGSVEQGGSKGNWLTDALAVQIPGKYSRIRAAVYFNFPFDGVDWRLETSASASQAFRSAIASSYYVANSFGSLARKVPVP